MSFYKAPSKLTASVNKRRRWKKRPKPYNAPKPEDLEVVLGKWKVTKVFYECSFNGEELDKLENGSEGVSLSECEGVEVAFDEQCDIMWYVPKGVEPIPLFHTTSFNIEKDSMDLFGEEDGKTFRFLVEKGSTASELILKTPLDNSYEEEESAEMVIVINKVSDTTSVIIDHFSLKEAFEDGFFSDLVVRSCDGVSFPVHRIVLACNSPKLSYRDWEVLLSGFKSPLVKAILEYVYTDSLPSSLSISLAKELCTALSGHSKLSALCDLCRAHIESNNLKQRLLGLVDDLQAALELAKRIVENTEMANPVKITYAVKQLAKEAAAGAVKLALMCELYTRNKKEMSKSEKTEVLEYVRGRVVVFVDLLSELIGIAVAKFNELTDEQKIEIATYIIPEVEIIWDMVNACAKEMETAMGAKVKSLRVKGRPHFSKQDIKVAFILQFIARGRELKRLQKIEEDFQDFVVHSHRRRDEFNGWSESERAKVIVRVMEGLEVEGMTQMDQFTDLKKDILVDNALDWKKFKIMVTVCCSYMSWSLRKIQSFKSPLRPVLLKALKFIHRSEVNDIMVYFKLLDEADLADLREEDQDSSSADINMPGLQAASDVSESLLAQGCLKLLASADYSDMKFVLAPPTSPPTVSGVSKEREGASEEEGVVILAHRVIVAARCEYFKRALQSGMKEDIDKCIVIHDCEESVFRAFLYFLYGGTLETGNMTTDDIIELMAVADRYETSSLRGMCEGLLVDRVEDGNAFALLQVADHYSARRLREMSMQHIITDPDIVMREIDAYSNLPDELKDEIRMILSSANPHLALRHNHQGKLHNGATTAQRQSVRSGSSSSSSSNNSNSSSDDSQAASGNQRHTLPSSAISLQESLESSTALLDMSAETVAFQEALSQLRGIVGEDASDEALKDILMAADMDINRAVNFYFS